MPFEEISAQIREQNPSIIAYSVYMWNYDQMIGSARLVKESLPDVKIILGGPQVSYNSVDVLKDNPQADVIVCGRGESRFKKLLKSDFRVKSFQDIPRLTFRDETGKIIVTQGAVEEDLTQIPSPYQNKAINLNDNNGHDGRRHTVYLETFRGCPFECGYCIWGDPEKALHKFPLDQILRDIEIVYNHPKVEVVYLTDACLFYTRERAKIICDKIASCSRKIPTVATLDILVLNEDMIRSLNKIPLIRNQFHFGLQSTNPDALDILKRKSGRETFSRKIQLLRKVKPDAEISFDLIYGLPGDNYEMFRESVDFALSLNPGKIYPSPLLLLPGTPFWDQKKELEFEYEDCPPFMVRGNKDYPANEMLRTFKFVLWLLVIMYFPAVREIISKVAEAKSQYSRVDLIDMFVELIQPHVNPVDDIEFDFTIDSNNMIRRYVLNSFAEPQNCLRVYETALEMLKRCDAEELASDILFGIEYYRAIGESGQNMEEEFEAYEKGKVEYIKNKWVTV